jgi:hypothetical protein
MKKKRTSNKVMVADTINMAESILKEVMRIYQYQDLMPQSMIGGVGARDTKDLMSLLHSASLLSRGLRERAEADWKASRRAIGLPL